jgi:hypothetical protein
LANCKVVYVHTISKSSKSDQIKRLDTRGITIAQVELDSEHVTQNHYQMFVTLYGKTLETTLPDMTTTAVVPVITTHMARQ